MLTSDAAERGVRAADLDAVALKPAECDVSKALELPVETVVVDYEGHEHFPDNDLLAVLAAEKTLRVTTPVRADGFDPLGDDSFVRALPDDAKRVLVAGHGAYLSPEEGERAVAPRFGEAVETADDAWVGTEGIERIALATGATQFELLSGTTARDVRAMRAAGFEGEVAVYAPTVLTDDEDTVLDAVGAYTARRRPVREALPEDAPTDGTATGRAREVLSRAVRDYALVGDVGTVQEHVATLREAGVDTVVGYPARGVEAFLD